MYSWSIDEKKFKKVEKIIEFLKKQPEVQRVRNTNRKNRYGNLIIKIKLSPHIHPAREFCIAKYIEEKAEQMKVSVIDE